MEATTSAAPGAAAIPEAQQLVSDFGRVIGVLTSPGKTFADIVRKPKWVIPIVLSTILGLAFASVMNARIDWKAFIIQQIEKSPRGADMPAAQKANIAGMQAKWSGYFAYGIGLLAPILTAVILGGIYLLVFNVMGGAGTNFKTAMSIVAHGGMTGLVFGPLTMLVMFLRSYGDVDPQNMIATSLFSFLPDDAPAWLQSVGNSVELFWFWTMFVMAIGFSAINRKKISTGKAFGLIAGVWMVWVFVKAGMAALFS